jgi:hypothetical protein
MKKERRVAHSDPRDRSTYVFKTESEYYQDYQFSKYAITTKKAGWDCLRHYEIMGNSCIPLFQDIQHAPRFTMMKFPKALLTKAMFFEKNSDKRENSLTEVNSCLTKVDRICASPCVSRKEWSS